MHSVAGCPQSISDRAVADRLRQTTPKSHLHGRDLRGRVLECNTQLRRQGRRTLRLVTAARERIALAGARLANLLNETLK